jgi:DNA repair protein RecO (recombination protein O)
MHNNPNLAFSLYLSKKTIYSLNVRNNSFTTTAIVLKRVSVGETDRIVNLLTQDFGKISVVAKGVRKMSSSKRASLEPGNIIRAFCIQTKSLPILTQATLIDDCSEMKKDLSAYQILISTSRNL